MAPAAGEGHDDSFIRSGAIPPRRAHARNT
jgi:hypothetical protein